MSSAMSNPEAAVLTVTEAEDSSRVDTLTAVHNLLLSSMCFRQHKILQLVEVGIGRTGIVRGEAPGLLGTKWEDLAAQLDRKSIQQMSNPVKRRESAVTDQGSRNRCGKTLRSSSDKFVEGSHCIALLVMLPSCQSVFFNSRWRIAQSFSS